jgi:MFS family permease
VYAVTFCCSIGFLLFGYDLGYMGGLTTSDEFLQTFGNPNASLLGFMVSSYEIGALSGALFQFVMGDRYGRKPNCVAGAVIVASKHVQSSWSVSRFADEL